MRDAIHSWVERYERAWRSNDPDRIGELFADGATYRASPADESAVGRDAIVSWWLDNADGPDDATFSFEVIGVDGTRGFVQGVTTYRASGDRPERTYDNLWVVDLDADDRAAAFTEWYVRRRS